MAIAISQIFTRGLTHKALAKKLAVSEKQIQRDEASGYATAGLNRLIKVAEMLAVRVEVKAELVSELESK